MQLGTVSSADRLSQGVIAWPQVRRIPMKTSKKSREKRKNAKNTIRNIDYGLEAGQILRFGKSIEIEILDTPFSNINFLKLIFLLALIIFFVLFKSSVLIVKVKSVSFPFAEIF